MVNGIIAIFILELFYIAQRTPNFRAHVVIEYFVFFSMNSKAHLEYTWKLDAPHMHSFYLGMCTLLVNHKFISVRDSSTMRIPHNIISKT